jgi:hypothetical protein
MNDLHYAVVLGIDSYPAFTPLNYARKDAQAFRDWLLDADGGALPPGNVHLVSTDQTFTSPDDAVPTITEAVKAFREVHAAVRAGSKANPLDWEKTRLYVYAAGHGIAPAVSDAAVLLANATLDELGQNIPCQKWLDFYQTTQLFREVVVFADCCREVRQGAPGLGPPFTYHPGQRGEVSWILGLATQYRDKSYEPTNKPENPDEQRGFFTRALLEALRNPSGAAVTSINIGDYLHQRVISLTAGRPYPQTPHITGSTSRPIVFRAAKPAAADPADLAAADPGAVEYPVTIEFTTTPHLKVELRGSKGDLRGAHDTAAGTWSLSLPNDIYQVLPEGATTGPFPGDGLFRILGEGRHVRL